MKPRSRSRTRLVVASAALALAWPAASWGGGFSIFEQGTKAMGMAGAFTAQADDGSAMFHNVGGLAFQHERAFSAGFTLIMSTEGDFVGAAPFPGPNTIDQQDGLFAYPPHAYWVEPIGERLVFGLGFNTPFGLSSNWSADGFAGRFISFKGKLVATDLTPTVAWEVSERLGLGAGLLLRLSEVELWRRIPTLNPFTGQPADVANLMLESDLENGVGFQAGLLFHATDRLSVGAAYRSRVEIDYSGDGRFSPVPTGFAQLDALVAAQLPFGRSLPIETTVEFPDTATVGVAYQVSGRWLVEVDANYAGWSSVDRIDIRFTSAPQFSSVLNQNWSDSNNYRVGARWSRRPGVEWRFGYVYDETPQPDESVSPLLPDADRNGFTLGHGRDLGAIDLDLALMLLDFKDRTTLVNQDNFNGTYTNTGILFGATVNW